MIASGRTVLVLGGARSGKTSHAVGLAAGWPGRKVFIATAEPRDPEMVERIARHRRDRGSDWTTVETPLELAAHMLNYAQTDTFVLVDCITLWVSNLMHAKREVGMEVERLAEALAEPRGAIVLVSNEVGLGIVPDNPLARRFRDEAGFANQRLAGAVNEVTFIAAGLPLKLK